MVGDVRPSPQGYIKDEVFRGEVSGGGREELLAFSF